MYKRVQFQLEKQGRLPLGISYFRKYIESISAPAIVSIESRFLSGSGVAGLCFKKGS